MAADQSRSVLYEIPFGRSHIDDLAHIYSHAREQPLQFVHQGDVDTALHVLRHFGRLGHPDARRPAEIGRHDFGVYARDLVQRLPVVRRHDFGGVREGMLRIVGIDAFGRIAHLEIRTEFQPGAFFEQRHALLLGASGIDRGFIHDIIAPLQITRHGTRGLDKTGQIGILALIDRGGHRDDIKCGPRQLLFRRGETDAPAAGAVLFTQFFDTAGIHVVPHHIETPGKPQRYGHAYISQPDHGQRRFPTGQPIIYHLLHRHIH